MKDTEFYAQILGLRTPWQVQSVELDLSGHKVEVRLGYPEGTLWACPDTEQRLPCHDHVERKWRHLDTCGFETILSCRVPRVRRPDGKVVTIPVPWAEKGSRFTLLYEAFAVRVLQACQNLTAAAHLLGLSWDQLQRIMDRAVEAVCIDMSGSYQAAVESQLPGVAIVHDRFHISQHLNDAVAAVHREENARLQKLGDERLKGTQRLFGFDPDHFNNDQTLRFAELKGSNLKTARAWAIKELFRKFWDYRYEGSARKFFRQWFGWASRSQLKPLIKVAKMIHLHFANIITYLKHPITNAVTEGLNSKIQSIKASARGFRSFLNYRTRILFFCGKLDLYPL